MPGTEIYLPLNVQQLVDLIIQLPKKQKQQLVDLLAKEDVTVSEKQKELVRNRIKKYKARPDKLIGEKEAWYMINAD
ncbi:MAG: hypothetical protein HYX40_01515 [Sphingobacteriales bacterium]|nr:hypothetical protein [Sphingobacteriales bacterium]